jgi:hypothetical protein
MPEAVPAAAVIPLISFFRPIRYPAVDLAVDLAVDVPTSLSLAPAG